MTNSKRQERRDLRRRRFVTDKEARLAARLARLDYKVSGETGAMKIPTKPRIQVKSTNRNAPARAIGKNDQQISNPIVDRQTSEIEQDC